MTDYTGVSMDVILAHLHKWRDSTAASIETLGRLRAEVERQRARLDGPNNILDYIDFFIDLFRRYEDDFDRLISDMPRHVSEAHVQIVKQIYDRASLEDRVCVNFKHEHIERVLKDEKLRCLVDEIYFETRQMLIDYLDLSNVVSRLRTFVGTSGSAPVDDDRRFALMAIEEARRSVPEDDRPHPKVGAVVVKNGNVLSKAHRGEKSGSHAEYVALDDKLSDDLVAGATVYTTLEPCTTRDHPKIPCARRIVDRRIRCVVVGMFDPNPDIWGKGWQLLRDAGIETRVFDHGLMQQCEEMNREFIRAQKAKQATPKPSASDRAATIAARSLTDATHDLQKAAWSLYALHTQYGVARAARDIAREEGRILEQIEVASRVVARDYDLPAELSAVAKTEMGNINIALVKLQESSINGRAAEMERAAIQVQDACERIRVAAKPHAYRPCA